MTGTDITRSVRIESVCITLLANVKKVGLLFNLIKQLTNEVTVQFLNSLHVIIQIIPPKEWVPRRKGYDDIDMMIPAPISQMMEGSQGLYQCYNIQKKPIHVKDFEKLAHSNK